jgi:branched-chain amino acid transport system substrate-binding protein
MYKSKVLIGAFVALVVIGAVVVLQKKASVRESGTIQIGAILPLTGDAAQYGNNDREGILLAVNQANAAGGINGHKIEARFEDCQTEAKLAISAFNKIKAEGVQAVIDDAISTISLAMVPLLEQSKTVLLSTGASNPSLSGASPFFFRIWNSDAYEGVVAADYIKKSKSTVKLAVLYINSDYGKGLDSVISKQLTGSQVQIVQTETFDKETRDFSSQVAKIRDATPTLIYLIGYAAQTGPVARQLREAGVETPIVGTVAMEDPEFIKLAGPAAEGVVYPFPSPPSGAVVEQFKSAFRQAYNKDPGLLDDCGYDAANLIIKAMREGGTSGNDIRAYLATMKDFQGASGVISFDANGDVNKPMQMKAIQDGKFVSLP